MPGLSEAALLVREHIRRGDRPHDQARCWLELDGSLLSLGVLSMEMTVEVERSRRFRIDGVVLGSERIPDGRNREEAREADVAPGPVANETVDGPSLSEAWGGD